MIFIPKSILIILLFFFSLSLISFPAITNGKSPLQKKTDLVNPFIGVEDGGGAAFVGTCLPFSMVRLGPDTPPPQNTSGYVNKAPIDGFSHTHVSGTGGPGKYGNIMVIPETGKLTIENYSSEKSSEDAQPGYYAVYLNRWKTKAELTSTERVGVHRYTFEADSAYILFDLSRAINVIEFAPGYSIYSSGLISSKNTLEGYGVYSGGWGPDVPYTVYFAAEFDQPFNSFGFWRNGQINVGQKSGSGDSLGIFLKFNLNSLHQVNLKVGISFLSLEKAKENLQEFSGFTFEQVRQRADSIWENALDKIEIEGGSKEQQVLFYTNLYHSLLMPTDVTGENPRWRSDQPAYWDYFALWDTFRTLHPLLTLIQPERQVGMINSLIDVYDHTGWMPECWTSGVHGFVQGGTSCDVVIADAAVRNLAGIDYEKAYTAIKKNSDIPSDTPLEYGRDSKEYLTIGYSSSDKLCGSSKTLEYAYNDFCVAQVAKVLGKEDDYQKYINRSMNGYNLFMPDTKFFWAKNPDGTWVDGFSSDFRIEEWWEGPYFYEGLPWHYATYVPHDIGGLIKRHGGNEKFVSFLDQMFDGGYYTQDNQPDIMTSYLYVYTGRPDKTSERVRHIMNKDYSVSPAGLPGQDDAGCMSSWYVFSSMGFYPNAGQDFYFIGSPVFSKITIHLDKYKLFTIRAEDNSAENKYIQSAVLNDKEWNKAWFQYRDIINGAELVLKMGPVPSDWGRNNPPPSVAE